MSNEVDPFSVESPPADSLQGMDSPPKSASVRTMSPARDPSYPARPLYDKITYHWKARNGEIRRKFEAKAYRVDHVMGPQGEGFIQWERNGKIERFDSVLNWTAWIDHLMNPENPAANEDEDEMGRTWMQDVMVDQGDGGRGEGGDESARDDDMGWDSILRGAPQVGPGGGWMLGSEDGGAGTSGGGDTYSQQFLNAAAGMRLGGGADMPGLDGAKCGDLEPLDDEEEEDGGHAQLDRRAQGQGGHVEGQGVGVEGGSGVDWMRSDSPFDNAPPTVAINDPFAAAQFVTSVSAGAGGGVVGMAPPGLQDGEGGTSGDAHLWGPKEAAPLPAFYFDHQPLENGGGGGDFFVNMGEGGGGEGPSFDENPAEGRHGPAASPKVESGGGAAQTAEGGEEASQSGGE
uniref:Uncharacterized protein n=1 Tax=Chromera velia CCMP2878 TaxID=1169474 RepID=A0A0G4FIA5_9ALVE|eukprot:Cvel_17140.t1-p1 / transcript=Cvel_17140.t1 / gene=Cvel_17140 / organism=Chromera_velia_CCMP2878 / gene_product=hypothetical protein / transcript_product=hypothetical protein / location=Cvel_scaffold1353:25755-27372(+) / protein_length=401 / sequence_SO=supercontig / SO=protein_coding / is_pseudo=false